MRIFVATLTNVNLAERGMDDDDSEIELVVPAETEDIDSVALGKTIWNEITAGVEFGVLSNRLLQFCFLLSLSCI